MWGALGSIGGALLGANAISQSSKQNQNIANQNLQFQMANAKANRDYGREIINMSKPDMSADELTGLLLQTGEQEANKQRDRNMHQLTTQYGRAGMPSSANDIIARAMAEMASGQGDRGVDARLKGIMGVLPGAAGLQIGGSLMNNPAPVNTFQSQPNMGWPLAVAGIGNLMGDLFRPQDAGVGNATT